VLRHGSATARLSAVHPAVWWLQAWGACAQASCDSAFCAAAIVIERKASLGHAPALGLFLIIAMGSPAPGRLSAPAGRARRTALAAARTRGAPSVDPGHDPDAMIVIDEKGCMQSFSAAAERLFGWAGAE